MNILVTGSDGYLGAHVCNLLKSRGHSITRWDVGWFSYPKLRSKSHLVKFLTKEHVEKHDAVIHLAWFSSAGNELSKLQESSLKETELLIDCCQDTITKLVFASTASVYGFSNTIFEQTEDEEPSPVCNYGRTKLAAEVYIEGNLPPEQFIIFRKGTLMGKGFKRGRTRLDLIVNAFLKTALTEGVIKVWDPETCRPLLHVQDAAQAYVQAAEGKIEPGIYNLAHKNYMVIALAHWVANLLDKKPLVDVTFNEDDGSARSYRISSERALEAGISIDRGVVNVVREFEDAGNGEWLVEATSKNVAWMKKVLEMSEWINSVEVPSGDS